MPTDLEILRADIGACPKQADAENTVRQYLGGVLKDPMSAVVTFKPFGRSAYYKSSANVWKYGWVLDAGVNAKNGYGGYTGAHEWSFYFRNGDEMVAVAIPDSKWPGIAPPDIEEFSRPFKVAAAVPTPDKKLIDNAGK